MSLISSIQNFTRPSQFSTRPVQNTPALATGRVLASPTAKLHWNAGPTYTGKPLWHWKNVWITGSWWRESTSLQGVPFTNGWCLMVSLLVAWTNWWFHCCWTNSWVSSDWRCDDAHMTSLVRMSLRYYCHWAAEGCHADRQKGPLDNCLKLAPDVCVFNLKSLLFKLISRANILDISFETAPRWMPKELIDDQSILVQVKAWCRQAKSHYLNRSWPRSMLPYFVAAIMSLTLKGWVTFSWNCILDSMGINLKSNRFLWNLCDTTYTESVLWVLMAWCFSTRASAATIQTNNWSCLYIQ